MRLAVFVMLLMTVASAGVTIDREANNAVFSNQHGNITLYPFNIQYAGPAPPPLTYYMTVCAKQELDVTALCGGFEHSLEGSDAFVKSYTDETTTHSFFCDSPSYGKSGPTTYWCYYDEMQNGTPYTENVTLETSSVNWFTDDGDSATVYWNTTEAVGTWDSIKDYFSHKADVVYEDKYYPHVYCASKDVAFNAGQCRELSFEIEPWAKNGKWDFWLNTTVGEWLIDPSWNQSLGSHRTCYNITNDNGYNLTNYTQILNIGLNSSITNGTDIYLTSIINSDSTETALGFFREDGFHRAREGNQIWNYTNASGTIWALVPNIPDGVNSTAICIYQNNSLGDSSNRSEAFLWTDDFNDGSLNTTIYVKRDSGSAWTMTETGGHLKLSRASSTDSYGSILINRTYPGNVTIYALATYDGSANRLTGVMSRLTSVFDFGAGGDRGVRMSHWEQGYGTYDATVLVVNFTQKNETWPYSQSNIWFGHELESVGGHFTGITNSLSGGYNNYTKYLYNASYSDGSSFPYVGLYYGWYGTINVFFDNVSIRAAALNETIVSTGWTEEWQADANHTISACQDLNESGLYNLDSDITDYSSGSCFTFSTNDVVLDCNGHTIDGIDNATASGVRIYNDDNITVRNCVLTDWGNSTTGGGVYLSGATHSTIHNSSFDSNGNGVFLYDSGNNTLYDLTVANSTDNGIFFYASASDNNLSNSTIYGSTTTNLELYENTGNIVSDIHLYNPGGSGEDFWANSLGASLDFTAYNLIFDNDAGGYTNYTNLSISDAFSGAEGYKMSWASLPTTPPDGKQGIGMWLDTYVSGGTPSIDQINWSYSDGDIPLGTPEDSLDMWRYNSTDWDEETDTLDTSSNVLTISNLVLASDYGPLGDWDIYVGLQSPADTATVDTYPISMDYYCNGSYPAYTANLTVNGSTAVTGIHVVNGTLEQSSYTPASTGTHYWNVTCWNGSNSNTSATWSFIFEHGLTATLISPADESSANDMDVSLGFRCTGDNATWLANVSLNGSDVATGLGVANNTLYEHNQSVTPGTYNWSVTCYDDYNTSSTSEWSFTVLHSSYVTQVAPADEYMTIEDSILLQFRCYGDNVTWLANVTVNDTDIATALAVSNNTLYSHNFSIGTGEYNWSVTCYDDWDSSTSGEWTLYGTLVNWSTTNTSINITMNLTYEGYVEYTEEFFEDYSPYIIAIISFGFGFLVTRRIPQTMISGAVGLTVAFFLSSNPMFLAGAVLAILIGFVYKQGVG